MNGWEGISQASAQGNKGKSSPKPTAVNEARPAYEVRFANRKPCKAVERPLCMIEIPCPRTDTLLTHRARGCRGEASPMRSSTRTFRTIWTIRTIRTIRTRLRQAAPWQAARTARNSARCQGKLYCSRRGVDGFPRTFPCRSTVPPVLRQFRPASFPPLSEKSEGSELSSRPLHRSGGSPVLHPHSLHRSTVTLVVSQHTGICLMNIVI